MKIHQTQKENEDKQIKPFFLECSACRSNYYLRNHINTKAATTVDWSMFTISDTQNPAEYLEYVPP